MSENQQATKPAYVPWQRRVVDERDQLSERLDKLRDFIESGKAEVLDAPHPRLLSLQFNAMTEYLDVLNKRIALIEPPST